MSLVKIEFEAEDKEEAYFRLQEIAEKIRVGYIQGEGWEILEALGDSLEKEE